MYYWQPIFKCNLCGRRILGVKDIYNNWTIFHENWYWSDSLKKRGRCLCDECIEAFNQLKDNREK